MYVFPFYKTIKQHECKTHWRLLGIGIIGEKRWIEKEMAILALALLATNFCSTHHLNCEARWNDYIGTGRFFYWKRLSITEEQMNSKVYQKSVQQNIKAPVCDVKLQS